MRLHCAGKAEHCFPDNLLLALNIAGRCWWVERPATDGEAKDAAAAKADSDNGRTTAKGTAVKDVGHGAEAVGRRPCVLGRKRVGGSGEEAIGGGGSGWCGLCWCVWCAGTVGGE